MDEGNLINLINKKEVSITKVSKEILKISLLFKFIYGKIFGICAFCTKADVGRV